MSNWKSIVLGEAFPGIGDNQVAQRDLLNKKVQELNALISQLNNEINDASTALGISNQTLQSLLTTGFNFLMFEPGEGGIIQRIETAGNQPPAIGQVFSTGIVIAAQAPTFQQIANNFIALQRVIDFNNHARP